jgi:hypothetical protein
MKNLLALIILISDCRVIRSEVKNESTGVLSDRYYNNGTVNAENLEVYNTLPIFDINQQQYTGNILYWPGAPDNPAVIDVTAGENSLTKYYIWGIGGNVFTKSNLTMVCMKLIIVILLFLEGCSIEKQPLTSYDESNVMIEEGVVECGDLPHILNYNKDFSALSGSIQMLNENGMWVDVRGSLWDYDNSIVTISQLTCGNRYRLTLYK